MYTLIDDYLLQRSAFARPISSVSVDEVESVRRIGKLLVPVTVRETGRRSGSGQRLYEIVDNEKGWIISQKLGWHEIPCVVLDVTDDELQKHLSAVTVEPVVDRQDPIQVALALRRRLDSEPKLTVKALAKELNLNRSTLQHLLRITTLPVEVRRLVSSGHLSVGHAQRLASSRLSSQKQIRLAESISRSPIAVRELENVIRKTDGVGDTRRIEDEALLLKKQLGFVERNLSESLGCHVKVSKRSVRIDYYGNLDVLDGLIARFGARER